MDVQARRPVENAVVIQNNPRFSWRTSLLNVANILRHSHSSVLDSTPANKKKQGSTSSDTSTDANNNKEKVVRSDSIKKGKSSRNTIVNIVLVEAKGIPASAEDGSSHGVFVKFRSGGHTFKSKSVCHTRQPQWRERFKLHLHDDQLLHISLWDKGRQKTFMGSSILDLTSRDRERTHDIWQELDGGYGSVHLSVTIFNTTKTEDSFSWEKYMEEIRSKYSFYNLTTELVGQLQVSVIGAKGLSGRPYASCVIELDNERIQTHKVHSDEPVWNKSYLFNIHDVTSVLELKVCDNSLNSIFNDFVGRVSIPLLKIENGVSRWYALKDSSKRKSAKGNCPRVNLEMTLIWNPVIASLKLFRPKEVRHIPVKHNKFDVPLIYKNVKFIKDTFDALFKMNESFKRLFEWEDSEFSKLAIVSWLVFWYYFSPWMAPLFIALLFPIVWYLDEWNSPDSNRDSNDSFDDSQNDTTLTEKVKGLPEMTFAITDSIEYMVSVAERLYNLAAFKVPFLSYLAMLLMVGASAAFYLIPFNYLMMIFGLYKFTRKYLNPGRMLNNDILDFISRIPDDRILKDWKELNVPEPRHRALRSTPSSASATTAD